MDCKIRHASEQITVRVENSETEQVLQFQKTTNQNKMY
jgi:hypothetical protein